MPTSSIYPTFRCPLPDRDFRKAIVEGIVFVYRARILELAHPRLIEALQEGTLTIHRAMQFCKLPRAEQLEQFIRYSEGRATNKVIRQAIARPREKETTLDAMTVLDALQLQEVRHPGSIDVQVGRLTRTVILLGQDFWTSKPPQPELKLA